VMNAGEIVEEIAAADLTVEQAQHPYTRALLAATPSVTERADNLPVVDWRAEVHVSTPVQTAVQTPEVTR